MSCWVFEFWKGWAYKLLSLSACKVIRRTTPKNGRAYKLVRAHFHNLFTNYMAWNLFLVWVLRPRKPLYVWACFCFYCFWWRVILYLWCRLAPTNLLNLFWLACTFWNQIRLFRWRRASHPQRHYRWDLVRYKRWSSCNCCRMWWRLPVYACRYATKSCA